jgi:hypothetical protein
VEQCKPAAADPDRLDALDAELIEYGGDVARALAMRVRIGRIRRRAVAAKIRSYQLVAVGWLLEDVLPVGAAAHEPVKKQQRLAIALHGDGQLNVIDLDLHWASFPEARLWRHRPQTNSLFTPADMMEKEVPRA